LAALALFAAMPVQADQSTASSSSNQAVTTQANLDFIINMGKFVFLRVGTGAYPSASTTIDTVSFALSPTIPAGSVVPATGNNQSVAWSGAAPGNSVSAPTTLPVEIRGNVGSIRLSATATAPLTSGTNSIPLSQILIATSDSNLPAPTVPDSGVGPSVTVSGTSFSGLVTQRLANWTFSYVNSVTPVAGAYTGQITFTAASP
jgi:hypothetical protein